METHDKLAAVPFGLCCIWFVLVRCAGGQISHGRAGESFVGGLEGLCVGP
jgi:hypothetical protein